MNKKYIVWLTAEERKELEISVKKRKTQAYRIKHANILLAVNADGPNLSDEDSAQIFGCHQNTVRKTRVFPQYAREKVCHTQPTKLFLN